MELNLLRIKVNEQVVARIGRDGQLEWLDLETFLHFCERYIDSSIIEARRRQAYRELLSATAIDLGFRSVGTGADDPSQASLALAFNVEEFIDVESD